MVRRNDHNARPLRRKAWRDQRASIILLDQPAHRETILKRSRSVKIREGWLKR